MTLGEFDIIRHYFTRQRVRRNDVILGVGDDGAVLEVPSGWSLVVAIDAIHEGVHFPTQLAAEDIGYRALAVNLSDLAAMGATPAWATLVLSLPVAREEWLERFAEGFFALAEQHDMTLVGGDIVRGPLSATVQAHGIVPAGAFLARSGAEAGHLIWVSGTVGDAAAGLRELERREATEPYGGSPLVKRFSRPEPRVALGTALRGLASAAIDLSDGLVADLGKLLEASRVGARITTHDLPISQALENAASAADRRELALFGGDDYELCFTTRSEDRRRVQSLAAPSGCRLTCIGEVTSGTELHLVSDGAEETVTPRGYDHFER